VLEDVRRGSVVAEFDLVGFGAFQEVGAAADVFVNFDGVEYCPFQA